jgi:hypothetical protein
MRRPGGRPGMFMSPLEAADETHDVIGERERNSLPRKMNHRLRGQR